MRTLICIRELPFAEATVRTGAILAGLGEPAVTLMTVVREGDSYEAAEERLQRGRGLLEDAVVTTVIREGEPAAAILSEARSRGYDLVVVGARGGVRLRDLLSQPVPQKVADRTSACVLVVPHNRPALRRVLICTSGKTDENIVKVAGRLAREVGAQATVLHVANPVPTMYTGLGAMEERLEELLQSDTPVAVHFRASARYLAELGVDADLELRHGVAHAEILRAARLGDYDLIVMGPGPLNRSLQRLLMDDVTEQVIERAPCPVLVVRDGCV